MLQLKSKKGVEKFATDEHARPSSTLESLAKLPTVFKKDGVVTAGSASGICDGAAALVIASEAAVKKHNLTPMARIVSWGMYVLLMLPFSCSRAGECCGNCEKD
jgi:acetyl-CoA acyltransferase 2